MINEEIRKGSGGSKEELIRMILSQDADAEDDEISEELVHALLSCKMSENINQEHKERLTFGQRSADKIAKVGGSWGFIGGFAVFLVVWMMMNSHMLLQKPFDPYPFIFLNLMLSCLAAIQAPIIMMAQNRQAEKDRMAAYNDFLVNLKSELISEDLHNKLDALLENQMEIMEANGRSSCHN